MSDDNFDTILGFVIFIFVAAALGFVAWGVYSAIEDDTKFTKACTNANGIEYKHGVCIDSTFKVIRLKY